jgi:hypothetical protein
MLPTTKRAAAQPATMCVHTTRMDAETHHTPHTYHRAIYAPEGRARIYTLPERSDLLSLGQLACRPAPGVRCNDECVAGEKRHRTGQHELSIESPLAGDGRHAERPAVCC